MKIKNVISFASLILFFLMSSAFTTVDHSPKTLAEDVDPSFVEFLSLFEKVELPFAIGLDDFKTYENKKATKKTVKKTKRKSGGNKDAFLMMEHIQDYGRKISRMGPPELMPIARFYPNEKTIAVIYMSYNIFSHINDLNFKLALFDLKGKPIKSLSKHQQFVLGHSSPYESTKTFSIDSNGMVIQKTYKAIWEKDVKSAGINNNKITDYVLEEEQGFKIQKDGVTEVTLSEDRASLD